ncbi:hypothetical protein [Labrys sp. LIt4]|uniref:hypothetical protein n=1 Tax=Labrys sp. LIt4 TaxID=2821355 RepID=UPI001AE0D7B0|nr:hypothetical protein [Labrys sp. LIt4]
MIEQDRMMALVPSISTIIGQPINRGGGNHATLPPGMMDSVSSAAHIFFSFVQNFAETVRNKDSTLETASKPSRP